MREPGKDKIRLEHMIAAIDRILNNLDEVTMEHLRDNEIFYYGIVKNIEIIGEAAYHLTKNFKAIHSNIPWDAIIAMRHVLVHDYYQINESEVKYVIEDDIPLLKDQIVTLINTVDWEMWARQEQELYESPVHRNMVQTAMRMKQDGISSRQISRYTGLTIDEVDEL